MHEAYGVPATFFMVADLMPGKEKSEPHDLRWFNSDVGVFVAALPGRGACLCAFGVEHGISFNVEAVMSLQQP